MIQTPFGRLMLIYGDIVSKTLVEGNHWNPHVFNALIPYLRGTVIDVGANVGALTMRFAKWAPQVVAYEPHPVLAACLRWNMKTLELKNVQIVEEGVYSKSVYLAPRDDGDCPSSWSWLPAAEGGVFAGRGVFSGPAWVDSPVSAIKVDAQGADLHALLGLRKVIERDHPKIVFEFERPVSLLHGHDWKDYEEQLHRWGYTIKDIGEGDWFCG